MDRSGTVGIDTGVNHIEIFIAIMEEYGVTTA